MTDGPPSDGRQAGHADHHARHPSGHLGTGCAPSLAVWARH